MPTPTPGGFKAFSIVCTHVGCLCDKVADGTVDCPCHGSTFKITDGAPWPIPPPGRSPCAVSVTEGKITLL